MLADNRISQLSSEKFLLAVDAKKHRDCRLVSVYKIRNCGTLIPGQDGCTYHTNVPKNHGSSQKIIRARGDG